MSFIKVLKGMRIGYLFKVAIFSLRHPFFAFATFKATSLTYRITQNTFPNIHGRENPANAFRHALWNMIILHKTQKWTRNIEKAVRWTKAITDLHEELAPNAILSKMMDLKNNEFGRKWFVEYGFLSARDMVNFLLLRTQEATKITNEKQIEEAVTLVYLED